VNGEERFEVGEIALWRTSCLCGKHCYVAGDECVIVDLLTPRPLLIGGQFVVRSIYIVDYRGKSYGALPEDLRKKRPPEEDADDATPNAFGSWDKCPWWPEKIVQELPA